MAFTPWRTWVAGAVGTAAQMNQDVRDNLNAWFPLAAAAGVAWTSYTPTLTQSATVTKTVTRAKYCQVGKIVTVSLILDVTGSGTTNNAIVVGLPVTAVSALTAIGTGWLFHGSANYPFIAGQASTTTFTMVDASLPVAVRLGQTGASMATQIVNTDQIVAAVTYEAA